MGLGSIDGHPRVVAHMAVGPRGIVEERCLAAVGIAYECHVNCTALSLGDMLKVIVLVEWRIKSDE